MKRVLGHTCTIARRNLMQIKGDPDQLMDATAMPVMFVLLFVYVFGGAIAGSSHAYLQFVIPGVMIQMAAFASARTGYGLNLDFDRGIVDRFRSLPIARSAALSGRILGDMARSALAFAVIHQNQDSAPARPTASAASPAPTAHCRAARKLSRSASSRSSQANCSGPRSSASACSAKSRK
jgi:hypothetical protein